MGTVTDINVPLVLVAPVVISLVSAVLWLARRYEQLILRTTDLKAQKREAAILLREALREQEPNLEPISFDDSSAVFEVEYDKDKRRVRNRSLPPPEDRHSREDRLSPRQERRVERYARGEDPSTPPEPLRPYRKKTPSRGGE